jgi:hypothetical protein
MHPVYISTGHISSERRNTPSAHAWMPVAFLPLCKFSRTEFRTAAEREGMPGRLQTRLYHYSMERVLGPLRQAAVTPVLMPDPYGHQRLQQLLICSYIADKVEIATALGISQNWSPECLTTYKDLGNDTCAGSHRTGQSILDSIASVRAQVGLAASTWQFISACTAQGLSGVEHPWWADFPHLDICRVMRTDSLHGVSKAFKDHIWTWMVNMVGKAEIDDRFRRLPKLAGIRSFPGGISKISQWSIGDSKDIMSVAMIAVAGARVAPDAITALRHWLEGHENERCLRLVGRKFS